MSIMQNRLKELRKERNLIQEELAERTKVDRSTISKYESGKREPSYDVLDILAKFFDVSVDYLLGRSVLRTPYIKTLNAVEVGDLAEQEAKTVQEIANLFRFRKNHEEKNKQENNQKQDD